MNNNYKRMTGAMALLLALFTSSCNDFLNKAPENSQDIVSVDYTKTENMFMPVSGVYAQARAGAGFSFWGALGLIAVRGDDVEKGSAPNDQMEFNFCKAFEYEKLHSYWALNSTWSGYYKTIQVANASLVNLEGYRKFLTSDNNIKLNDQYMAEVRFLRAYAYFLISRMWGAAPIMEDNQAVGLKKSSREQIYEYIKTELTYCIANLPARRPNEMQYKGQVTKYSASALLAKAAADMNDWDTALTASSEVVNSGKFSLYNDFYQLFKKPGRNCDESLFELQYTDFGQGSGDIIESDAWFAFQGPRSGINGLNAKPIDGGWGFMTPTQKLVDALAARGEKTRETTIIMRTGKPTPDGDTLKMNAPGEPVYYNGKAYLPTTQMTDGRKQYGEGNNIRMIRYADILLLNAEAKVRKGQNGDAELNLVRQRAGLSAVSGATVDQILEERRIEMACEWGERFFDLVRTGKAEGTLPGFVKGKHEFYPIPLNQIDLNPNLKD